MNFYLPWFDKTPRYPFYIKGRTDIIRVHITKTAGTSISRGMRFYGPNKKKGIKKHYFAKEIIDIVGQKQWDNAFKFTFVRNPWDRLFSLYRYQLRKNTIKSKDQRDSFSLWLKDKVIKIKLDPTRKAKPQVDWLTDYDEKIDFDFIGRFENLEEDIKKLAQLLNMKIKIPHINQSLPIVHYSSAYDDELEELIRVNYKNDIDTFNYQFERK